jgi:hypothetical protein
MKLQYKRADEFVLVDMRVCKACPHCLQGNYIPMFQCHVLGRDQPQYRLNNGYMLPDCCVRQLEHIMAGAADESGT